MKYIDCMKNNMRSYGVTDDFARAEMGKKKTYRTKPQKIGKNSREIKIYKE